MKSKCDFVFFGEHWTLERVSQNIGGSANVDKNEIKISAQYDEETFLMFLHHELMESAIECAGGCFSKKRPTAEDISVFGHDKLDIISQQTRMAYEDIKKKILPTRRKK